MSKLSIGDLLSFAKAGYTPKDVKELLSMEVAEPKSPEDVPEDPKKDPEPEKTEKEQKTESPEHQKDSTSTPGEDKAEVIDYKSKYEELEKKLQEVQKKNTGRDISGMETKDPLTGIDDFLKSIM